MTEPRKEVLADGVEIWLGDCRDVLPMIGRVDAVVTDPPYGMSFRSNHRAEKHAAIANDGDIESLVWATKLPITHSRYIFCRWDNVSQVDKPKSLVTWVKNNWSMGDLNHEHARQTEVALFYAGPDHFFPKSRPTDVIECARTGNNYHPTEKPADLMRAVVEWTSGVVLDPFCGSGTTGVACAKLARSFIGIEIDPGYFDIARRRISEALKQPDMFVVPAPKLVQASLL